METDPATRNVYLNTTYSNNNIAIAFGSLGLVAVLAPALYIGYLASTTGQTALSISRVRTELWDLVNIFSSNICRDT